MAGPQKASKNACLSIGSRIPPALRERRTRARLVLSPRPCRSRPDTTTALTLLKGHDRSCTECNAKATSRSCRRLGPRSRQKAEWRCCAGRGMDAWRATKGPRHPVVRGRRARPPVRGKSGREAGGPDVGRAFSLATFPASNAIRSEAEQQPQAGPKHERCESSDSAGGRNPRQQHRRQPLLPSQRTQTATTTDLPALT